MLSARSLQVSVGFGHRASARQAHVRSPSQPAVTGGPAFANAEIDLTCLGPATRRLWTDGSGEWGLLDDGCPDEPAPPFASDGAIYTLDTIGWSSVQRADE